MHCKAMLLCALLASHAAAAAEIWRCRYPDGSVEWRGRPCPASAEARQALPAGSGRGTFNVVEPDRPPAGLLERARGGSDKVRRSLPANDARAGHGRAVELRCAEHESRLAAVNRRLRRGYAPGEGNELRAERRRIEHVLNKACR